MIVLLGFAVVTVAAILFFSGVEYGRRRVEDQVIEDRVSEIRDKGFEI